MSIADRMVERYGLDTKVVIVPIKCTSTSPFQVQINGSTASYDAVKVSGQSFSVNDLGTALWCSPSPPICFKTL